MIYKILKVQMKLKNNFKLMDKKSDRNLSWQKIYNVLKNWLQKLQNIQIITG